MESNSSAKYSVFLHLILEGFLQLYLWFFFLYFNVLIFSRNFHLDWLDSVLYFQVCASHCACYFSVFFIMLCTNFNSFIEILIPYITCLFIQPKACAWISSVCIWLTLSFIWCHNAAFAFRKILITWSDASL